MVLMGMVLILFVLARIVGSGGFKRAALATRRARTPVETDEPEELAIA